MKEQQGKTKPTKKRVLVYYLVLAASLLIIAGITVGIVFAVKNNRANDLTLGNDDVTNVGGVNDGNGDKKPDDGNGDKKPDDGKNPDDGKPSNVPTGNAYISPVADINVSNSYVFGYNETCDNYRLHQGMDFAAAAGTEVVAAANGKVVDIVTEHQLYSAYITIEHDNGVRSTYKYIVPAENLKVGDTVKQGDKIATVAEAIGSEIMSGDHLHFEIKVNGKLADPDSYLNIISK